MFTFTGKFATTTSAMAAMVALTLSLTPVAMAQTSDAGTSTNAAKTPKSPKSATVANVDGVAISLDEFTLAMRAAARQKLYHRDASAEQLRMLREEVIDKMILRMLVVAEAGKRKIAANDAEIAKTLKGYDDRYADSAQWKQNRASMLPRLRRELTEKDLEARLEAIIKQAPTASDAEVRAYYDANRNLFTEPTQFHVAVLLLKVDPSATKAVRDAARAEAKAIHARLTKGAEFATIAKIQSAHPSAANGGDMGYLHAGMLPEALDKLMIEMKPGQLSAPTDVLEGVAILKLMAKKEASLRKYADVTERAAGLLQRERATAAWDKFTRELRRNAKIELFPENILLAAGEAAAPSPPAVAPALPGKTPPTERSDQSNLTGKAWTPARGSTGNGAR